MEKYKFQYKIIAIFSLEYHLCAIYRQIFRSLKVFKVRVRERERYIDIDM